MNKPAVTHTDFTAIKTQQKRAWAAGDLAITARPMVGVAENLCEAMELHAGQKVLDVATGTGNVALAAARRYCDVTGIDYVPDLLKEAQARSAVERLEIHFIEADAEQLPFPETSFDVVLSAFGVMFAPNQEQAAQELLRVCRPGGKIGLLSWTPDGFFREMGKVMGAYAPAPVGLKPPALWGTETRLTELFGTAVSSLQTTKRFFYHRYRSLDHAVDVTCNAFGPTVTALKA
ncbi:MAG TPA: class I SAM-dependent methyltransferase, partial [Ktedonobacteraceae bacterium]|nr:class I SAM-dependent methyltransferase [Ktedonobacteraceae bacterium]